MSVVKKIWANKWILRSILYTIYFNIRYLPFKQAIRLPILLYKPHFISLNGKISIASENLRFGMIQLGKNIVPFYPNDGIKLIIRGTMHFNGRCIIGNNSILSIGENGVLSFGEGFMATSALKLSCMNNISYGNHVTVGWDCLFTDCDFHKLKRKDGSFTEGLGTIEIGAYNWLCSKNVILKNVVTPNYCTISANTTLNKDYSSIGEYKIIATKNEITEKAIGFYMDPDDPRTYECFS